MEIEFAVESSFIRNLQRELQIDNPLEVVRTALTLLNWVVDETGRGQLILAVQKDGTPIHRLSMPSLERLRPPA